MRLYLHLKRKGDMFGADTVTPQSWVASTRAGIRNTYVFQVKPECIATFYNLPMYRIDTSTIIATFNELKPYLVL